MKFLPSLCAEFPNDNSQLHDGALWVCPWTRAMPRAVVRADGLARVLSARCSNLPEVDAEPKLQNPATPLPPVAAPPSAPAPSLLRSEPAELSETPSMQPESELEASEPLELAAEAAAAGELELDELTLELPDVAERRFEEEVLVEEPFRVVASEITELWDLACPPPSGLLPLQPTQQPELLSDSELFGAEEAAPISEVQPVAEASSPVALRVPRPDEIGVEPAPVPQPGFSVPRPGDWSAAETDSRSVLDPPSATDEMTPLPLEVAVTPMTAGVEVKNPQPCDDPFVSELRALIAGAEPKDPGAMPMLEIELTPAPPSMGNPEARWNALMESLSGLLLSRGATRAAALLPQVLEGRKVALDRLNDAAQQALLECGHASNKNGQLMSSPKFRAQAVSFRVQFEAAELEATSYLQWLSTFLQAYLADADVDGILHSLQSAGLERLIQAA